MANTMDTSEAINEPTLASSMDAESSRSPQTGGSSLNDMTTAENMDAGSSRSPQIDGYANIDPTLARKMAAVSVSLPRIDWSDYYDTDGGSRSGASTPASKFFRKRKMKETSDSASDGDTFRSPKMPVARRGRGRPPSTGQYVGLAKAKADIEEAQAKAKTEEQALKKEAARRKAEMDVQELTRRSFLKDAPGPSSSPPPIIIQDEDINTAMQKSIAAIELVAKSSGNLKGTFVRALKDAVRTIKDGLEEISYRSVSDETRRLQADNARLQRELAAMREEVAAIRKDLAEARQGVQRPVTALPNSTGFDTEEFARTIMVQVGTMVNARLEGLQDRLLPEKRLRPPLAADKRRVEAAQKSYAAAAASAVTPSPALTTAANPKAIKATGNTAGPQKPSQAQPEKQRSNQKQSKGKKGKQSSLVPAPAPADPTPSTSTSNEWTVVRKTKKKKSAKEKKAAQSKKAATKVRPPRSAAVLITLDPAAKDKGISYAQVLTEAKKGVDLAGLGISALRIRQAATGARILEVPGAASGDKADALANSLRSVLPQDAVRVSRPTKCAELRISGLDDSVTSAEVVAAVARATGADSSAIKCGEVSRGANGLGAAWLRCPVAEAKKLSDAGRLLVGWVSARVSLLDTRPLRCFRCLEVGHTRANCGADVDRSGECYRCGRTGHKASQCREDPHCTLCAAVKRPAAHRLGSKACSAGSEKKGAKKARAPKAPEVVAVPMEQ